MAGEPNRHSSTQPELDIATLAPALRQGVVELRAALPHGNVRCVHWNDHYIGIVTDVDVDLPSRGPIHDVDIRPVEPVIVLLHRKSYPQKAPLVYSDRKDFPSKGLPHLNPTSQTNLASLCLHRGSLDDWFAEHTLSDLVDRARAWLRDAASNRLIRENDRFEGTRLSEPSGIAVYRPIDLVETIERSWAETHRRSGWRFVLVTLLRNASATKFLGDRLSYEINFVLPNRPTGALVTVFQKYNQLVGAQPTEDKLLVGLLVWGTGEPLSEYFAGLPSTYGELRAFCTRLSIDLDAAIHDYRDADAQLLGGVPIVIAVLRPQPLIGASSPVELLNFSVLASHEYQAEDGTWKDHAPVFALGHRTPLTVAFAREMSREWPEAPSSLTLIGCGAVGSKLSLHLARAGHVDQTLIDPAELSPHHLVRHGLPPQAVGQNKAEALAEQILSMYRLDQANVHLRALPASIFDLIEDREKLAATSFVIDATASTAVLSAMVEADLPPVARYLRCEITDEGRFGLLFWEGPARNPRVDDLQAFLFNFGRLSAPVSRWLQAHRRSQQAERAAALEEIGIGMSCSSTTLRLADDTISYHTSVFSAAVKLRDSWARKACGKILLSQFATDGELDASTQTIAVPPVEVMAAEGSPGWQVRVHAAATRRIRFWMRAAGRKETGGLLLGYVHRKRRTIYVTDALPPSPDSEGTPYAFKRGVKDYPRVLDEVSTYTGDLIGYVGEWHTHPRGRPALSDTDRRAIDDIRRHLETAGLPTHIMIFAQDETAAFVYAPD